eukprot:scaffold1353_cov161-Amphora_coffeaeformis.AAC.27
MRFGILLVAFPSIRQRIILNSVGLINATAQPRARSHPRPSLELPQRKTNTKHQTMSHSSSSPETTTTIELSDYERTRAVNIERNNARLRELGLITAAEEKSSNDLAWKRRTATTTSIEPSTNNPVKQGKDKNKKRKSKELPPEEPARKSLRVQGKDPEGVQLHLDDDDDNNDTSVESTRQSRVEECRQVRQLAALRYSQLTDAEKKAAQENPTATYEHCLKRVRTMTDKALYNRIRAIERAVGKHCVVKMAIFKSCLQDEGLWDLAEAASAALERLKALQPPVES